jgi:hypothetical protein
MTPTRSFDTVPLPLAIHLAMHTIIGLFCAFAGGLNLIDPTKILPQGPTDVVTSGVGFLALCGLSWGYVFGIFMGRREVLGLGFALGAGYLVAAAIQLPTSAELAALWAAIGAYGLWVLATYRRQIVAG